MKRRNQAGLPAAGNSQTHSGTAAKIGYVKKIAAALKVKVKICT